MEDARTRVILLDVEGTTTPVDFVYRVLFPYARARVRDFVERHGRREDVRADIALLRAEYDSDAEKGAAAPPAWRDDSDEAEVETVTAYVHWLMERDRKSTALKSLQGKIWEEGYEAGALLGQVYADVPPAFARWNAQRRDVCIYSSGSRLAQRLLFRHTTAGDLSGLIRD